MKTKDNLKKFLYTVALSVLTGFACGLVGTLFVNSILFVTALRGKYSWILYFLVVLGVATVGMYTLLKLGGVGTNNVIKSVRSGDKLSPKLSVAIFFGTVFSHLGGASVGREGAALQLGGSVGELVSRIFKIDEDMRRIIIMSGMAGCFSALFGTPLAAFVFILELVRIGKKCIKAIVPVFISSVISFGVANCLNVSPERFPIAEIPEISFDIAWKTAVISVAGALISIIFVYALHGSEKILKKLFKNELLRVAAGGLFIIVATKLLGTTDYNGGGIDVVHNIFTHGEVNYEAFLLKLCFTVICVGAGFKGGEIVPTIFIGGTLGGALGLLMGVNPGFAAAIGITAMFSGVTNCPFATAVLACEMFSMHGAGYFVAASVIGFALSGKVSLYSGRKLPFVKNIEN